MSDEIAIKVENLTKSYKLYSSPLDRLKELVHPFRKKYHHDFNALNNISFEIKRGETVGIIGKNGSGKSTLLKLITGVLTPTSGRVTVNGKVSALLELGAGFNPELTGVENVYFSGMIAGFTREEMDRKLDDILSFADSGEYVYQPVKSYSSGMLVRLAFAVVAHVDADILIVDEALSVGDAFFVQKCMRFLRKFMEKGTVLFVSHDIGAVLSLCQTAVWIDFGKIRANGIAKKVADSYMRDVIERGQINSISPNREPLLDNISAIKKEHDPDVNKVIVEGEGRVRTDFSHMKVISVFNPDVESFGIGDAEILSVSLKDVHDKTIHSVNGGDNIRFHIVVKAHRDIDSVIVGCFIRDRLGQTIAGDTTEPWLGCEIISIPSGVEMDFVFEMMMPHFPTGTYTVSAAIAEGTVMEGHVQHHFFNEALAFECHSSSIRFGLAGIIPERVYWYRTIALKE